MPIPSHTAPSDAHTLPAGVDVWVSTPLKQASIVHAFPSSRGTHPLPPAPPALAVDDEVTEPEPPRRSRRWKKKTSPEARRPFHSSPASWSDRRCRRCRSRSRWPGTRRAEQPLRKNESWSPGAPPDRGDGVPCACAHRVMRAERVRRGRNRPGPGARRWNHAVSTFSVVRHGRLASEAERETEVSASGQSAPRRNRSITAIALD